MALSERFDRYQQRHARAGFPLAVLYKYLDDGGGHLAALLTYYAFLSLFPLLLLASTILSVVLRHNPSAQHAVLTSALSHFPVIGKQLAQPEHLSGGPAGVAAGVFGAAYGALGVAVAGQSAMNTIWNVPRHRRPNPFTARLRALLLLALVGVAVLLTTGLSALAAGTGAWGGGVRVIALVLSVMVNALAFVAAFRVSTTRPLAVRDVAPGALAAAAGLQVLQLVGKGYVTHYVRHASATNSVFAVVLGLLAFLYLTSVVVVVCAEANAVRVDGLYPRSLLTPVTDDVRLTEADELAYAEQAKAQQAKGFEHIEVDFEPR